ncbi:dienelactone hydrolase family protein [Saccharopolyspora shandongensis]|uniref:dienelactone hydrolase family protein n=1 Tax=Saccharopolyspora shandongensis TaxID=418495 RepID=UPI0033EF9162
MPITVYRPRRKHDFEQATFAVQYGHGTPAVGSAGRGGRDSLISADEWQRLGQRLREAGVRHELIDYPHAEHGFLCEDRPGSYDPNAAKAAWKQILKALAHMTRRA